MQNLSDSEPQGAADPIGCPIFTFCIREGIGSTTVRKLIADGSIKAFRVGRKLMVDVRSYREFVAKQLREGMPEYTATEKAIEARQRKRAEAKHEPTLEELGL